MARNPRSDRPVVDRSRRGDELRVFCVNLYAARADCNIESIPVLPRRRGRGVPRHGNASWPDGELLPSSEVYGSADPAKAGSVRRLHIRDCVPNIGVLRQTDIGVLPGWAKRTAIKYW